MTTAFFGSIYREKALISWRQVELLAFAQGNQKGAAKGKAISILAHKLARAIFYMLKNNVPFDREKFLATA